MFGTLKVRLPYAVRVCRMQFRNGTSAHKRPFGALNVLSKTNYVQKITKQIKISGKIKAIKLR